MDWIFLGMCFLPRLCHRMVMDVHIGSVIRKKKRHDVLVVQYLI